MEKQELKKTDELKEENDFDLMSEYVKFLNHIIWYVVIFVVCAIIVYFITK